MYYVLSFKILCIQEETSSLIQELAKQLHDLVELNKELREENNHLRKIY